jgi:Protein of unknown function (DUF3307)
MTILALKLLLAHIIGDFAIQPLAWVEDKNEKSFKSKYLYFHIGVHFLLLNLFFITEWRAMIGYILLICVAHLMIDIAKIEYNKRLSSLSFTAFILDQIAHISVLGFIAYLIAPQNFHTINSMHIWSVAVALALNLFAFPLIIKIFIQKWTDILGDANQSLIKAGYFIGIFERIFIVLFVLFHVYEGIGFLLAAKSIFRIGDLKENKEKMLTEYILLGTLISFLMAFVLGLWLKWQLGV